MLLYIASIIFDDMSFGHYVFFTIAILQAILFLVACVTILVDRDMTVLGRIWRIIAILLFPLIAPICALIEHLSRMMKRERAQSGASRI